MMRYIQLAVAALSVVLGLWVGTHDPLDGLSVQAMRGFGVILWAVGFWISQIIPEYITGLMMCVLWVLTGAAAFPKAFSNFGNNTWWLIVSAFALGAAVGKCGLLRRIALVVLKLFSPTFKGQVLGIIASGTIVSPLIPSMNAKGALSSPIVLALSRALGYEDKSKGAAGLFGASFVVFCLSGLIFMSASVTNYVLLGLTPKEAQAGITWTSWFVNALPWGVVVIGATALFVIFAYNPGNVKTVSTTYVVDELKKLGRMSRNERITATIMLCTLFLWMFESVHKISAGVVGVSAMCALLAFKVIDREDFRSRIDWAALVFIGATLNMAVILQELKIDKWLGHVLEPYLGDFLANPYLLVLAVGILMPLMRFIFVSITSAAVLFVLVLSPLMMAHGMHPWIIVFLAYTYGGVFIMPYMNSMFLCSYYSISGEMCYHKQLLPLAFAYSAFCIAASMISIPYWRWIGLIK